jgi:hypothetical protein
MAPARIRISLLAAMLSAGWFGDIHHVSDPRPASDGEQVLIWLR